MARRKVGGAVKLNFKDVETRSTPPEGDYLVRVAEAENGKSGNGNPQTSFIFEIEQPKENKGNKLYLHCPHAENSLWKLASVLTALGVEVPADELEIDTDDLVDRKMMAVVHHETYNGKKQARLGDWAPASEFAGSDDDDDDKSSKKDKKSKKAKKAKDEPAAEEAEEKTSKKSKKDKGDKKEKKPKVEPIYESDDISDMSEKKLAKLIKEHELDVDLDDYKTDRKKAGAVIDALEAAGLMKD